MSRIALKQVRLQPVTECIWSFSRCGVLR